MYTYEAKSKQGVLKVTIPAAEWEEALNRVYEKTKGKYSVQGFRQGKAPRRVIEQTYGDMVFFDDAFEDAIGATWAQFLTDRQDVNPASRPRVEMDSFTADKGLSATLTFDLMPEVTLGAISGLKTKPKQVRVTNEMIDAELNRLQANHARYEEKDGKAENGDFATIDFVGSVDGKKFEGGTAENYRLELGSHTFIEGFEAQVEGMEVGQTKDVNVNFPQEYHVDELKGKPAVFSVTLKKLEKKQLPTIDDKFIANTTEFETLDEYKKSTKEKLTQDEQKRADYEYGNALIDEVTANAKVDIPEAMIDDEAHFMIHDLEHRLSHQNMTLEQYLSYTGMDMAKLHENYEKEAAKTVKTRLVLQKLIADHNIKVEESDLDARLNEMAGHYNMQPDELKKNLTQEDISYFQNEILMQKIIDFIKAQNKTKNA